MTKEDYTQFFDEDADFIIKKYPYLTREDKMNLWVYRIMYDFRNGIYYGASRELDKFTESNYIRWREIEPDFDTFIASIMIEYMPAFPPWFEGCHERTLESEIYRRMGITDERADPKFSH